MGEYDKLFYKYPRLETPKDGLLAPVQAWFRGESCIPGAGMYAPYRAYVKPGVVCSEAHFHRDEQYLAFVGHDLRDAFESFDAEIELWLGEEPDDMEKIVVTKPTMIRVPRYFWHGPIEIKRVTKPLFFQPVLFSGRYYAIRRRFDKEGRPVFDTVCEGFEELGIPAPAELGV